MNVYVDHLIVAMLLPKILSIFNLLNMDNVKIDCVHQNSIKTPNLKGIVIVRKLVNILHYVRKCTAVAGERTMSYEKCFISHQTYRSTQNMYRIA